MLIIYNMALITQTVLCIVISCLIKADAKGGTEFTEILSLLQKQELVAARMIAEKVVADDPDNVHVKYLLASIHATAEGGDLAKAVRLGLEVLGWAEGEVRAEHRERAATLALDAALKSDDDLIIKYTAEGRHERNVW